jgi:hypothetical protein
LPGHPVVPKEGIILQAPPDRHRRKTSRQFRFDFAVPKCQDERVRILILCQEPPGVQREWIVNLPSPPRVGEYFESGNESWVVVNVNDTPEDKQNKAVVYVKAAEGQYSGATKL